MSGCKCPKSDVKPIECIPYFVDITTKMEERRCDLIGRQKLLREKISTMERSIPALIAYNMWMAKDKCDDAPTCKVREIMKKFSTHPDPTEKLLANLKKTVTELNGETAELHEKIIQADVKLEETDMELESLELLNKEMNEKLTRLEREVNSFGTPSLHSIHSEDLICLSKIRQLAKDELCLKHCIKQMELKETLFKEHMDRLLTCREYQNTCDKRKMTGCLQNMDCSGRMACCEPKKCLWFKPGGQCLKKKQGREDREVFNESEKTQTQSDAIVSTSEHNVGKQDKSQGTVEKKTSWIPNWWSNNQKTTEEIPPPKGDTTITIPTEENNEPDKPVTVEASTQPDTPKERPKEKTIRDKLAKKPGHANTCKNCGREACPPSFVKKSRSKKGRDRLCAGKFITPCNIPFMKSCKGPTMPRKPCFDVSCHLPEHGIQNMCKYYMPTCDLGGSCEICPMSYKNCFRPPNNCRCNCKGKCAKGLSEAECNCSDALLDPLEEYQPTAAQLHKDPNESNSDDDFCECCSCGCEDSDGSFSCQCN
ncbi:uncharacterized protein LOC143358182 isoform X2 [Halictus rubicundus]|uniref:uncharacterized protein LOC143358182 isoform X2 n=1 Tax=Halictus rubicundus TaxID=77578 RepID=UPI004035AF03